MELGRIVEQGTHEALLKKGGYYKNLYEAQFLQVAVGE
jgi:ABC-type multidrug transport system fused ATPase/permease subunit